VSSFCEAKKTGHFLKPIGLENEHVESSDIDKTEVIHEIFIYSSNPNLSGG